MALSRSKRLFAPTEQKQVTSSLAVPDAWTLELFGSLPAISGVVVTPESAMRCTPVRCAVQAIAEAIGQLPVHVYNVAEDVLTGKIAAADSYIGAYVGGDLGVAYPDGIPAALQEAVRQLASHFYENREAVVSDERRVVVLPYGVETLIAPFRQWAF